MLKSTGPGFEVLLARPTNTVFDHAANIEFDSVLCVAMGFEGHGIAAYASTLVTRYAKFAWNVIGDLYVAG